MPVSNEKVSGLTWPQRVNYWVLRAATLLLSALSVRQSARAGAWLGVAAFRCMSSRRRTVINNLRIVFQGRKSWEECEGVAREVFRRTGANFVGGYRAGLLSSAKMAEVVNLEGLENARTAMGDGRGVIVLLGHMGPWEVLAQVAGQIFPGVPTGTLFRPIDTPAVDAIVRAEREKRGARLFSRKEGLAGAVALLREGGALGLLADQRVGSAGVWAPFFGREASTTRLPWILHRKTGAALITLSARTVGQGRWSVRAHPPLLPERESLPTREAFARRCNELLEEALRTSVEDVFWFHKRWRPNAREFFPAETATAERAVLRRVLVVLPEDADDATACARAVAGFAETRNQTAFVLAGVSAGEAAGGARLPDGAENVVEVSPNAKQKEIAVKFRQADRLGPVGIDGGIFFGGQNATAWSNALRDAGVEVFLGPKGAERLPGLRPAFSAPVSGSDPEAYRAILDRLAAEPAKSA